MTAIEANNGRPDASRPLPSWSSWHREAEAQRTAREQAERERDALREDAKRHLAIEATEREGRVVAQEAIVNYWQPRLTAAAALVEEMTAIADEAVAYTDAHWPSAYTDELVERWRTIRARAAALFGEKGDQEGGS